MYFQHHPSWVEEGKKNHNKPKVKTNPGKDCLNKQGVQFLYANINLGHTLK